MIKCQKKIWALKLVLFYEKKMKKIPMILTQKIDFESQILTLFVTFWHLSITPILIIQKFLWICWFLSKNLSNPVPPAWKPVS